jgi:hypothetical protein
LRQRDFAHLWLLLRARRFWQREGWPRIESRTSGIRVSLGYVFSTSSHRTGQKYLLLTDIRYPADFAQPVNLQATVLFIAVGVGLYFYFESEKKKIQEKKRGFS